MGYVPRCGLVAIAAISLLGTAVAQDAGQPAQEPKKVESVEKKEGELPRTLSEEEKSLIEREVQRRVKEALEAARAPVAPPQDKPQEKPVTPAQLQELNDKIDQLFEAQKKVLPSEFNPAIGLVGETIFSYRNRGPALTGSTEPGGIDIFQRSVELNIAAAVDPFFKAYGVINASGESATGEIVMQVEEASLVSTSLPWNLSLQAGRFFAEIGRLGNIHDHELPFVNRPLALDQYIGGESQTDGLQINWLVPVDQYISITAGLGDGLGTPPNNPGQMRGAGELNYWGRGSTYFDLSPDWQLESGVSGLINPRADDVHGPFTELDGSTLFERRRGLVGIDVKLSFVPLQDNQFRGFTWGTEVLYSDDRYTVAPAAGSEFLRTVGSWGGYSYVVYKFDRQWSVGALAEHVENEANHHQMTSAYSPFITWATSHWNEMRLQFTRTEQNSVGGLKDDNAIYLQWTWIIGAHSHGWQQR